MTMPLSCALWNQYLEADKRAVKSGNLADRAEADRLFKEHHEQALRETEEARAKCKASPKGAGQ